MSERIDGLAGMSVGCGMLGGHFDSADDFLFWNIHDSEAVQVR